MTFIFKNFNLSLPTTNDSWPLLLLPLLPLLPTAPLNVALNVDKRQISAHDVSDNHALHWFTGTEAVPPVIKNLKYMLTSLAWCGLAQFIS
jgi:hypothetical protein